MRNQVRIIGGKWRGRKLRFADAPGLRPTHDRVRETVFNWLAPYIGKAYCLDMFAGSGAFGFEALSRGATHVTMLDAAIEVVQSLRDNAKLLEATQVDILQAVLPKRMPQLTGARFDVIFLDPPFYEDLIPVAINWLQRQALIATDAVIYIEAEKEFDCAGLQFDVIKYKKTGALQYMLCKM